MLRRLSCSALIALLAGSCSAPTPQPAPVPATVNADCAPWDGAAFTISMPYTHGRRLDISIWHSAEFPRPARFSIPETPGRDGSAALWTEAGQSLLLHGSIRLEGVARGQPVEGEYELYTPDGTQLRGRFQATWGSQQAYCG